MTQETDLCKTCEHYWRDFPMPLDEVISHCEIVDQKYGMLMAGRDRIMDDVVPYPCLKCPFDSYKKKQS